jgi:hypothetical protein
MSSTVAELIIEELGLEVDAETLQDAIDRHRPATKPKVEALPKAKPSSKKSAAAEVHTCEYTITPAGKPASICGKNAKTEFNGMWYCGTEANGHLKTMITKAAKVGSDRKSAPKVGSDRKSAPKTGGRAKSAVPAKGSKAIPSRKVCEEPETNALPLGSSVLRTVPPKARVAGLIKKVIEKREEINLARHHLSDGTVVFVYWDQRIVFDGQTNEAYGVLDEDDDTILELTDAAIRFLDAHNLHRKANEPKRAAKAKVASKAPSKSAAKAPPAVNGKGSKDRIVAKAVSSKIVSAAKAPKAKTTPTTKVVVAPKASRGSLIREQEVEEEPDAEEVEGDDGEGGAEDDVETNFALDEVEEEPDANEVDDEGGEDGQEDVIEDDEGEALDDEADVEAEDDE